MMLNAVMCVWNEEDIIESTVKHALAQGCSNVYIVDNASTDKTVDTAIRAGAKLATTFETKDFDEDQKVTHLNATVKYINEITSEDQIWWLYLDADEFPNFDCKFTVIDVLKQVDSSIKAVHGHIFDHIPTHQPYHVSGYHPADFQPLCIKRHVSKVPLLRYDKEHPHLWSIGGAHDFITHGEVVPIIRDFLHIHHFPYRNPIYTLPRSKILAETRNEWCKKFLKQVHKSDVTAYELRYNKLHSTYNDNRNFCLKTERLIYDYSNIVRWYDIYAEKQFISTEYEKYVCYAIYYFFIKEYDIALCRFTDALNVCDDNYIKLWLMIKIAECLASTNINESRNLISSIRKSDNIELNDYLNNDFAYFINQPNRGNVSFKDLIGKIEFYQSVFPDGIEESYRKLTASIEQNIFK